MNSEATNSSPSRAPPRWPKRRPATRRPARRRRRRRQMASPSRKAPPCTLVVFGASGDLTARKLLPAIDRLAARGALDPAFTVVGVARTEMDDDDFRARALDAVPDASP